MKKVLIVTTIFINIVACKNNKEPNSATSTDTSTVSNSSSSSATIDKSAIYGKWYFKNAAIKMTDAKGELIMNDTIKGSPTDYFLINADGTSESHIGTMVDKTKYKFINESELVTDDPSNKEKASLKIVSISAFECTLSLNQKKPEGNMVMMMFLKK